MIFPALHRAKKTGIKIRYYDYIFGVSKWIIGNAMLGCLDNHFPDDEKHQSSGLLTRVVLHTTYRKNNSIEKCAGMVFT